MKRIAVIAPTEIPARRANTLQVMKMTQAIKSLGHDVRLAVPGEQPAEAKDLESYWIQLSNHYGLQRQFPIHWLAADPRLRRYDFSFRAAFWARRWNADLLYTRLPQVAAIGAQMGLPTILEVHDLPQGTLGPWLVRQFLKNKNAHSLVVITQALAADMADYFSLPASPTFTIVAPDGVDLDRYNNLPSTKAARRNLYQNAITALPRPIDPEQFTAGYTGHLYAGRGTAMILELAASLPEIAFLIVGGEPEDVVNLQNIINARKLENTIVKEFVPNAELPRYQAACDVLLMPYGKHVAASSGGDISRYLSPMKLFEYLACERAIISSDLPVLKEVLNSNNAILLPYDDLDSWINAIKNLQSDPGLRTRLAKHARQDANQYTWEARAAKILIEV